MSSDPARPPADGDWAAWSQASVEQLQARCDALLKRNHIARNAQYRWDLDAATLRLRSRKGPVTLALQCVGTLSGDTFRWGWANDTLPPVATASMPTVRAFGEAHGLGVLVEPEWPADHGAALEMLAISGRVLDAQGFWIDETADLTLYFLVFQPQR